MTDLKLTMENISKEKARSGTKKVDNITEKQSTKDKVKSATQVVDNVANINNQQHQSKSSKQDFVPPKDNNTKNPNKDKNAITVCSKDM